MQACRRLGLSTAICGSAKDSWGPIPDELLATEGFGGRENRYLQLCIHWCHSDGLVKMNGSQNKDFGKGTSRQETLMAEDDGR